MWKVSYANETVASSSDEDDHVYMELIAEQRTPGWFQARKFRCTASKTSVFVTGKSQFSELEYEINLLTGRELPPPPNHAMQMGTLNEEPTIEYYCKSTGFTHREVSLCVPIWHDEQLEDNFHANWFIAGSPDGIISKGNLVGNLEVKYPQQLYRPLREKLFKLREFHPRTSYGKSGIKGVDNKSHIYVSHYMQMQQCMAITGNKWCSYVVGNAKKDSNNPMYTEKVKFRSNYFWNFMYPELVVFVENYIKPRMSKKDEKAFRSGVDEIIKIYKASLKKKTSYAPEE